MSTYYGVNIKRSDDGTGLITIAPLRRDREGYTKPVKLVRASSPEAAQRWIERHFGPVEWAKLDQYYPAGTAAACSIESTPAAVQAAR